MSTAAFANASQNVQHTPAQSFYATVLERAELDIQTVLCFCHNITTLYISYTLHYPISDIARRATLPLSPPLAPESAVWGSGIALSARASSHRVQIDLT